MATWSHLVRFEAEDGQVYFASLDPSSAEEPGLKNLEVTGFTSISELEASEKGETVRINKILSPVPYNGDIICIGVNYRKHAEEANLTVPLDPVMWYKPRRALRGPGDVPIPKVAAENFLDFEGELVIVTSKDALDVSCEDAPNYILGYTVGNDLTARGYQDPKRGGNQFTRCKSFDGFAPTGPILRNSKNFGDWSAKRILTKVNGKVFQDSPCDLIHSPAELVSFLSQGTTLPAGSVIMTGSPPGIGYFSTPRYNLKDGDVVSIEISDIGTLSNTMVFGT